MNFDRDEQATRTGTHELILSPGEYAFFQDKTSGNVVTNVGPMLVTQQGSLRPLKFVDGDFRMSSLEQVATKCVTAEKGQYVVLHNPTVEESGLKHPATKTSNASVPDLRHGEKIIVAGPCKFALWPEQDAEVIDGHDLRPDQYLLVRIYDEQAATANWGDAVVETDDETSVASQTASDLGLTQGKLLIIKDVSFYIPPTGVEVVPDEGGDFVRDALTLEMSEYCILIDQSGDKRYEVGPQIVFPEPTEEFFSEGGSIKFKPIELTPTQGLHIKINCDYTDTEWPTEDGDIIARDFEQGEEIFITGASHPIYFPREEHAIIMYGDKQIHYATAVPSGQARYVMNKLTGEISTRPGPDMILLNPTEEVFVQRILSDAESMLMYPGNQDSLTYNQSLRTFQLGRQAKEEALLSSADFGASYGAFESSTRSLSKSFQAAPAAIPDQIRRSTTYTKPHSVTLDERFSGVPTLKIWTGFAVLLVKADGTRRVEVGPKVVTLDYDETLSALHLSTGKPKTTDDLLTVGYLEVENRKVSDIIRVETDKGVEFDVKVSYRVSFTGDNQQWFNVDNPIKLLCDHARSLLKGAVRKKTTKDFHGNTADIVRDTILGKKTDDGRVGLTFEENGMTVTEVEILSVTIIDSEIGERLNAQQRAVVTNQIEIERASQELELTTARTAMEQEQLRLQDEVRQLRHELSMQSIADNSQKSAAESSSRLDRELERETLVKLDEQINALVHTQELERDKARQELELAASEHETTQIVARFEAASGDFAAAIRHLADQEVLEKVAEAMGPMRLIGGGSITDALAGLIGSSSNRNALFERLTTLVEE